jgi:hypothetical protein
MAQEDNQRAFKARRRMSTAVLARNRRDCHPDSRLANDKYRSRSHETDINPRRPALAVGADDITQANHRQANEHQTEASAAIAPGSDGT